MSPTPKKPVGRPKKGSKAGTSVMFNPGRPPKTNVAEMSHSTKMRRAEDIAKKFDVETIQRALDIAKRNENRCESNEDIERSVVPHSNESATAFFLENDFSKAQWERIVKDSKNRKAGIYPSFFQLAKVKAEIRPPMYSVQSEVCVQVNFGMMLNLSAERLIYTVGTEWTTSDLLDLKMIVPYGFDSSSGFKNPHQRFESSKNITLKSELSLFASTFTIAGLVTSSKKIMWLNPTPQSVRFCRPLRIALQKETDETIIAEADRLRTEISQLRPHRFSLPNGKNVSVNFDVYFCMIDGKVLNRVLDNDATTRCPICLVSMSNFNRTEDWNSIIPEQNLKHGLGNLHCEIKTLEQLIKLSCRLPLRTWTVRRELKDQLNEKMAKIKEKLFKKFYVRTDEVQHGSGTAMNGNTARRCFKDHSKLATELGIKKELVKRLAFVVLAFKQKEGVVDLDRLEVYSIETYKLYFKYYPWAKLNPSVHKMLRHGVAIAKEFPLSLAYFAEDAAESMHKNYRKNSISHARQNSRSNRLLDVFNRAVDTSDPLLSMQYLKERVVGDGKEDLPSDFISLLGTK